MSEKQLWAAVCYQAFSDLIPVKRLIKDKETQVKRIVIDTTKRDKALRWINSDQHGVGSFVWICDVIDLDARKLRQLTMTRSGIKKLLHIKEGQRSNIDEIAA